MNQQKALHMRNEERLQRLLAEKEEKLNRISLKEAHLEQGATALELKNQNLKTLKTNLSSLQATVELLQTQK